MDKGLQRTWIVIKERFSAKKEITVILTGEVFKLSTIKRKFDSQMGTRSI